MRLATASLAPPHSAAAPCPASAPHDGPLSLRVHCALRQSRTSPRHSPPQRSHMLCPDTTLRCAPAQPSTAPLLSPARRPYNIRPCSPPSRPCTAPPCVPAMCPCATPRGALAEPQATLQRRASPCAVPPRPRSCRALTACGLLSAAPRPTPPPQPTRPSVPSHRQPRRMACTGPMGSRQRPYAPALARLRGSQAEYPDRGQPPRPERSERPLPRPPAEEPRSGPDP